MHKFLQFFKTTLSTYNKHTSYSQLEHGIKKRWLGLWNTVGSFSRKGGGEVHHDSSWIKKLKYLFTVQTITKIVIFFLSLNIIKPHLTPENSTTPGASIVINCRAEFFRKGILPKGKLTEKAYSVRLSKVYLLLLLILEKSRESEGLSASSRFWMEVNSPGVIKGWGSLLPPPPAQTSPAQVVNFQ